MSNNFFSFPIDVPINKALLHKYHPISKQSHDRGYPNLSGGLSEIGEILRQKPDEPIETRKISLALKGNGDAKEMEKTFMDFLVLKSDGETVLDEERMYTLLGIVDSYIDHDYRLGYIQTEMQDDAETTRQADDYLLGEAREQLKQLRNLLYIRDIYQGKTSIRFECETVSSENKPVKDKEMSTEITIGSDQKELLDVAIKTNFDAIITNPYNPYLQNLCYSRNGIEATYDSVNNAYEQFRKPETGKTREVSKDNLFRGKLVQVMKSFVREQALHPDKPVLETTMHVKLFDVLLAFGWIDTDKANNYTSNKQKSDYIRHLPTDGFPEISIS